MLKHQNPQENGAKNDGKNRNGDKNGGKHHMFEEVKEINNSFENGKNGVSQACFISLEQSATYDQGEEENFKEKSP